MEYLVRFSQSHETFRLAEIHALARIANVTLEVVSYDPESPFCIIRMKDDEAAAAVARRSILVQTIHSLWGMGATLDALHEDVRKRAAPLWPRFSHSTFKMELDSFRGKRSAASRLDIIDSFAKTLPLKGSIDLADPDCVFTVFEFWVLDAVPMGIPDPEFYYLGRFVGGSSREAIRAFDLKKRRYIATTSMDAELSLLTANMAMAAPGKIFYDPFVGTGSFPVAAAFWGAIAWGSDIDGRSIRGLAAGINGTGGSGGAREGRCDVRGNFEQYGLLTGFGDVFSADMTNSPIRKNVRWIDGIACDPPYGVREGPRVLGVRNPAKTPFIVEAGKRRYKYPTFVPPKQPYSFLALLNDLLQFAADTLVDDGRLSFWMPTSNNESQELPMPSHPCLEVDSVCLQVFNKWTRRLITYRRLPDSQVDTSKLAEHLARPTPEVRSKGLTADELNPFRKGYFSKFTDDKRVASEVKKVAGDAEFQAKKEKDQGEKPPLDKRAPEPEPVSTQPSISRPSGPRPEVPGSSQVSQAPD